MEIYCGGLPAIGENELEELFKPFGQVVRVSLVRDFRTGETRGFGFVEIPDAEQARAAIAALDGTEFHGRTLRVNQSIKSRGPANYKTKGA
jgi:RNA recognition motif-containing protein